MAMPGTQGIIYADERFGLHQLRFGEGAGAYASQSGDIVTRWASQWERPELWIFDFHHHLFTGDNGEWVIGIAGLARAVLRDQRRHPVVADAADLPASPVAEAHVAARRS